MTATVDGQPHGITVNVTDPASGATVKYGTEEGSYTLDASPTQTEVGTQTVYYQVTADNYTTYTGSATVTVSDKSTQTINASDVTATYGDTDKKVEATTDGNGAITYAVKDGGADYIDVDASTGALTIKKVGTATVIVTAAETSTYAKATKEVTVTINKANAVAASVTANNRTYDGTEKPLVTVTGEPTGGTMQYALGTATEATQPYTTSIPTATNAGTYYVWYKAVGDENHNDSEAVCVTVTVANPAYTNDASHSWYKGSGKDVTLTAKLEGDFDDSFEHFTGVELDGVALSKEDYSAVKGSTVVTLKASTLEKLQTGPHGVSIRFDNGKVDYTVTVKPAQSTVSVVSPKTGDENNAALWLLLLALSATGVVLVSKKRRA